MLLMSMTDVCGWFITSCCNFADFFASYVVVAWCGAQSNDRDKYWHFSKLNHQLSRGVTLRGMLRFKTAPGGPVPLEEVEPAAAIVKRFVTGESAMCHL